MARIAGIDLPKDKSIEIGLTYIYGIGQGYDRIIERGLDMCLASFDVLFNALFCRSLCRFLICHRSITCFLVHSIRYQLLLLIGYSAARALAGSCVGLGSLTSNGQASSVAKTSVATDLYESLDVKSNFSSEATLNGKVVVNIIT